jgi:hypothetical protein
VESARQSLQAALERVPARVATSSAIAAGHPADVLSEISREIDLLVCGSRGYGPIRSVLLGGVTHRLTREAHCPVVVVPRSAAQARDETEERTEATTRGPPVRARATTVGKRGVLRSRSAERRRWRTAPATAGWTTVQTVSRGVRK